MAEADLYKFAYKEVAEALVKQQGIHDGLWALYVEFGIAAANMNLTPQVGGQPGQTVPAPSESDALTPAAIVPVLSIGLIRSPSPNRLTVNAAEVNPRSQEK